MNKDSINLLVCWVFSVLLSHALNSCSQRTFLIATKSGSCLSGIAPTNKYARYYALDTNGILYQYDPESRSHSALSDSSFVQAVAQANSVFAATKYGNLFTYNQGEQTGIFIDSMPKVAQIIIDESMCTQYERTDRLENFDIVLLTFADTQETADYKQISNIKVDSTLPSSSRWDNPISWEEDYGDKFLHVLDSVQEWQSVSVSRDHAIALDSDGNAWAWGANCRNQLGIDTLFGTCTPKKIDSKHRWRQVKASVGSSIAIHQDSSLWFWGGHKPRLVNRSESEIGASSIRDYPTPTEIDSGPWKSIHGRCAIKDDGSIWTLYHLPKAEDSLSVDQIPFFSMTEMNENYKWIYVSTRYFDGKYRDIAINDAYQVFVLRDPNDLPRKRHQPLEYLLTENRYRQVAQLNDSTIIGVDPEGICYEEGVGKSKYTKQVYKEKVANLSEQGSYLSEESSLVIEFASGAQIVHETKERLDTLQYNGSDYKIFAKSVGSGGTTVYIIKKTD